MHRFVLLGVLAFAVIHCFDGIVGLQLPEASELQQPDEDFETQLKSLQRNVSDIWTYIYELRGAVSNHLTHLRQHQVELESSMQKMEHLHESESPSSGHHHSGEHSHSGEQHSHSSEHSHGSDHSHGSTGQHSHGDDHSHGSTGQHSHGDDHSHGSTGQHSQGDDHSHGSTGQHSHGDDHSHGSMEQHSHGDDHSHGSMEQHSHSGEQHSHGGDHSHSGEHHSHSGEHHSHSGEHGHQSHSYSHSHAHSKEDSHSHGDEQHHHGPDPKDNHETEDLQTQQVLDPVAEPVIAPTARQEHYHHHHGHAQSSRSGSSGGMNLIADRSFHHHHHHHQDARRRNRTVELPRYSDYGQYDLASCRVLPNRALPQDLQQNVVGTVTLWQKKSGGPLNFHVQLRGFDVGGHHAHHQTVQQDEDNEARQAVGHRHGFHVHAFGDLSNGCQSMGPHYNPKGVNHGGAHALVRHVGDLGNIECDEQGNTNILFSDNVASLRGEHSVLGKGLVIHAVEDDLGLKSDSGSLTTGNSGTRLACCVIQEIEKIQLVQYKAMKSATHYQNR